MKFTANLPKFKKKQVSFQRFKMATNFSPNTNMHGNNLETTNITNTRNFITLLPLGSLDLKISSSLDLLSPRGSKTSLHHMFRKKQSYSLTNTNAPIRLLSCSKTVTSFFSTEVHHTSTILTLIIDHFGSQKRKTVKLQISIAVESISTIKCKEKQRLRQIYSISTVNIIRSDRAIKINNWSHVLRMLTPSGLLFSSAEFSGSEIAGLCVPGSTIDKVKNFSGFKIDTLQCHHEHNLTNAYITATAATISWENRPTLTHIADGSTDERIFATGMSRIPFSKLFNSTGNSELEKEIDSTEPIEVDPEESDILDEERDTELQINVSKSDITDISEIAASLNISGIAEAQVNKRQRVNRDTSAEDSICPPTKKLRNNTMMEPLEADEAPVRPVKFVVKLVPDIEGVHLFTKGHGVLIHNSVRNQLKKEKDPDVNF